MSARVRLGKLALALFGVLLGLLVCELYFRAKVARLVADVGGDLPHGSGLLVRQTPRGKRLVPNARVMVRNHGLTGTDIPLAINSLGLRDEELSPRRAEGELRVLVLGDSITLADYLPREQVYVERAEQRLRDRLPGRPIEVINAGLPDIGLREEIQLLEDLVETVRPDTVVLAFYLNDSRPPWGFPAELGYPGWVRRHSMLAEWVYREASLRRFFRVRGADRFAWYASMRQEPWASDPAAFSRLVDSARYDWGAAWSEDSWTAVGADLDRLRELAGQHGFAVSAVAFPVYFQIYAGIVHDAPQRRLEREAQARGFAYLDLLPLLRAQNQRQLLYDYCHPLPEVNAQIGALLADFLTATYGWR